MTQLLRIDQLPELVAPDGASLVAVEEGGVLYKARVDSIGGGGGGGGTSGHAIESNGAPLTQRATLNVTGLLSVSDSGGKTVLTLAAIALASQVSGTLPVSSGGTGLTALGTAGQSYRVNALGTALEFYTPSAGLTAPTNPTDDGKVAVASGGNLSYSLIANANVSTSAAIALSKLATIAADRVLGSDAGGVPIELTVTGGLEFTGSGGIERSALSGAISASAGSNTTAFASGDFGALSLVTTGSLSVGTTPASAGNIRLPNLGTIKGRDVAGTGDIQALLFTNGDAVVIGDSTHATIVNGASLSLRVNNGVIADLATAAVTVSVATLRFDQSVVSPIFTQTSETGNSVNGDKLTIHAQHSTGTTTTGGAIDVGPGTGTTAGGTGRLITGAATARFSWNDTGVAWFSTSPVSQRTLTDSTGGTPATSLVDVGVVFNQANINNNFASIRQLLNQYGLAA